MKQKGFAPIIILLLIGIGVLGYFGYQYFKPTIQLTGLPANTSPPASPTSLPETPPEDPTANWKIFSDTKNGIQFKYPQTWTAKQMPAWALVVFLESHPFEIPEASEILTTIQVSFNEAMNTITNQKFYEEKTLEEGITRISDLFNPSDVKIVRNLKIGGKNAAQISGTLAPGMLQGEFFEYTIIQMDNRLLFVSLHGHDQQEIYNQILATFKFTQ